MERTFGLVYPSIPISVKRGGEGGRGRKSYLSSNGRYHSILGEERDIILGEERDQGTQLDSIPQMYHTSCQEHRIRLACQRRHPHPQSRKGRISQSVHSQMSTSL